MNFDERKRTAAELVVGFLSDYTPPRGLDASQQASRISHAADAFARRMPVDGDFSEKVEAVLMKIRDTHLSNSWPAQAAFVMAMPQLEMKGVAPKTYRSDDPDRVSKLMNSGAAVPEHDVWRHQNVDHEVMARYRFASVQKWQETYRHEAEAMMVEKYGNVVRQYFLEAAE